MNKKMELNLLLRGKQTAHEITVERGACQKMVKYAA